MDIPTVILGILFVLIRLPFVLLNTFLKRCMPATRKDMSNEIVLITGSAQGIGKEIALGYGRLGATVVCVDVSKDINEATVSNLKAKGFKAYAYSCDITSRDEVFKLAKNVEAEVGSISILVNNAGVMTCQPIGGHTEAQIRRTFDVNVIAHFWTIQAFLPGMLKKDRGHIVAIASSSGLSGCENATAYATSKWAVRGFMINLCEELWRSNSSIKLTTAFPHFVNTTLCQKPNVGKLFNLLSAESVARRVIKAQMAEEEIVAIPVWIEFLSRVQGILPMATSKSILRVIGAGVNVSD